MRNEDKLPRDFRQNLDDLAKLGERYGFAAAKSNLVLAADLMAEIKHLRLKIEGDVVAKGNELYNAGLELGRESVAARTR